MASGVDVGSLTGSDFKGDESIKKIMESEAKGKIPIQNEKFRLQMQKQAWDALQAKLSDLATATRNVFSPAYSAFRKIQAHSSAPELLDISGQGLDPSKSNAASYSMIPKQMANSDHFKSDSFDSKNMKPLAAARFTIQSGEKEYPVNFEGGSLDQLIEEWNKAASEILTASRVDADDGSYLDIQGKGTGKKSAIRFSGDTDFLKSLGLIQTAQPSYYDIEILSPRGLSGSRQAEELLMNGTLTLQKGEQATKQLPSPQNIVADDTQLWLFVKKAPSDSTLPPKAPENPEQISIEGLKDMIWVGDVNLTGDSIYSPEQFASSIDPSSPTARSAANSLTTSLSLSIVYDDGKTLSASVPWRTEGAGMQILKTMIPKGKVVSIQIRNNTTIPVSITKGQIATLNKGQWEHKNSITQAQNSIVNYRGTDYERDSNTITDLVPGTLQIGGESSKPVNLSIDYDFDSILEQIKEWIIAYNNTMDYIKNTTQQDFSIVSRLNRDRNREIEEKRQAYEKLSSEEKEKMTSDGTLFEGFLSGDSTMGMLKTKLQAFTKKQYSTDLKEKLMFLNQLGIAIPNASQLASMSEDERNNYRAGYLDFSKQGQDQFLALLKQSPKAVQQLFFDRVQNSKLFNAGMLFDYDQLLSLYLQRYSGKYPGFFLAKSQLLDSQIQSQDKQLSSLDDKMKRDEDKLRNDFSKVYDAQNSARSLQQRFSGFSKGN